MTKTDTKTAEAIEQEFDFGSIDVGDQLEVDELDTIKAVEKTEEVEEKPEETDEEPVETEASAEESEESE